MTERDIIRLFLDRNEEAIQAVDEKYGRQMNILARHILHSQEDAEECCNDTLLKLWNSIPPDIPRRLYSYIMQILRRTALDRLDWIMAKKRHSEVIPITEELENILCEPAKNMDEEELLNFIKGIKLDTLVDNLEKAGVPEEYYQTLSEVSDALASGDDYEIYNALSTLMYGTSYDSYGYDDYDYDDYDYDYPDFSSMTYDEFADYYRENYDSEASDEDIEYYYDLFQY